MIQRDSQQLMGANRGTRGVSPSSPQSGWGLRAVLHWCSSQFKNSHFTDMCCDNEAGSYLRPIDSCITQVKVQGPPRTYNESKEEEAEDSS